MNFGYDKRSTVADFPFRRFDSITETIHHGEEGRNGRPRVKEEVIIPPQYEKINLFDSNEEIRF